MNPLRSPRLKLVFLGSGAFGLPTLRALIANHDIALVVSQPDRPAGRGSALTPTPIASEIQTNFPHIPILKPEKINLPEVRDSIRALNADAFVVIAFGQKLGRALLDGVFAINLHGSILPRWRGAAPINAAILAGDPHVGNSVITLADKMDAGLVLATSSHPLDPAWTTSDLHDVLSADGPDLIERVLRERPAGVMQDESLVTIAPKFTKSDGWIDFRHSADECRRRIHGLNPWPGVTVQFRGQPLKLHRAKSVESINQQTTSPGALLDPALGIVACANSALQLLEVQPANKRPMPWPDFARGHKPQAGELVQGRTESPIP
ncbi:MAG: methionyl-tRNA formyltransferase [Phycisphaeraceae bacterium]|nr:methionyl-tRNA formyltransferase [Phycisphaeraceae bacterium]